MRINSVQIRHYRSIECGSLIKCGGLNVLIGKNNAGKSNCLSAIESFLGHLRKGVVAEFLPLRTFLLEFTDRDTTKPFRIAVEFELLAELNMELRERLSREAPHLDRSIQQIKTNDTIVFVLAGFSEGAEAWLFVEQIAVGPLRGDHEELQIGEIRLLSVPSTVGRELARIQRKINQLSSDVARLSELSKDRRWLESSMERKSSRFYAYSENYRNLGGQTTRAVDEAVAGANSAESLAAAISEIATEAREEVEKLKKTETEGSLSAFAGPSKSAPAYALWLIEQFGAVQILHLEEEKQPIGRDEAGTLLDMKLQRGGMDRLQTLQQTIKALLGVYVDAFQARDRAGERAAEMDVDNFLVEANGAGIRESLRLILDLELKKPSLLLLEEPEVHLHPGLARVMASYLREKSRDIQMFVATHSTEFVDSVAFQNAYLVSRDKGYKTVCQSITQSDGPLLLPSELGLRLSSVFMFDRLAFVEGPSDETILRSLAKTLRLDMTKSNVGFVHMCGVRNFAHFAAEGTLDLLAKRRVQLWFVADRDERDDEEVKKMEGRLGPRATLRVLSRRELENYLIDENAIKKFLDEKKPMRPSDQPVTLNAITEALREAAEKLKPEVVRLRLERRLLTPIFLNVRTMRGTVEERIRTAAELLKARLDAVQAETAKIEQELNDQWGARSLELVPGTLLLEQVAAKFDCTYSKDNGDGERLARHMTPDGISRDLKDLLSELTRE